ncbi:DNA-binding transcriptional LysR family regulator [Blastococcus colisei]|uniref:DNA-binding transcriptional LysR family regulator n=1 Tax=Blastococcus colisei TaxID=1564162 RepID=A0A543PFC4_9ACTN|nr:LysR family transcriptional regulator [Blastococcus colisei]TQN42773.1 DNA-binding transcriptional LysR family regulator [Blastococcus colisei]
MDLRRVEHFLAVVDAGTVTAAAGQIRIAQPALSRQLLQFERDLGIRLFDRARGRLALTPAGREFVPVARELMAHADRTQAAARHLAEGVLDRLLVAAPTATISELLAPFLSTLRRDDPLVLVREVSPTRAYAALETGADLAISPAPVTGSLAHLHIGAVPLRAHVSPDHPWAQRSGTVELAELVEERLLLLPQDNVSRIELDLAVARAGLAYGDVTECAVGRVIQAHAAAGHGVGVVTDLPRFGARSLRIAPPDSSGEPLRIVLHAAWDPTHFAADVIESMARRIGSFLATVDQAAR